MADAKLAIEYRTVDSLIPYAANSRTHTEDQVKLIAKSMETFGFTNPILIDAKGVIIAGHGRLRAAAMIGLDKVPTITLTHLSKAQQRALVIADNRLAETEVGAGWSMEMLRTELGDLKVEGFDLSVTGFDDGFLSKLFEVPGELGDADEDAGPPPEEPVSRLGDVWLLGDHRLVCGDATTKEAVDKALNGVKPMLCVTDVPYGVSYDPSKRAKGFSDGANRATGKVANDDRSDWGEVWALFPGSVVYVWHAFKTAFDVEKSLREAGYEVRSQIIWKKTRPVQSVGNINPKTMGYNPQHEACFYAVKKGGKVDWKGDRSQSTVWDIDHIKSDTGHGTQKPVEAMERPIRNNSSPGQVVFEPFSGSGTTIVACERTGRSCAAIELMPGYVDVAILRWQTLTGQNAALEATGQSFTEVAGDRTPNKVMKAGKASVADRS